MYYALSRLIRRISRRRELGVAFLLGVLALSVLGNTVSFYFFDRTAQPDLTIWDSLWYSVISITTIGYGDLSASTAGARIGTAFFIIVVGLAAFTTAVGLAVDWLVDIRHKERTGMAATKARHHLIIVNFPNESRVRQIIDEFTRDRHHRDTDVVVLTDQIEEMPFDLPNFSFVRGSPLERGTFERANISRSSQAIVLSPSYDDPRSDSFVASVSFLIEHLTPGVKIIAECLDPSHAVLFNDFPNLSLVYTLQVANNLLVQEAQDPGVNLLTQVIISNVTDIEETLASTPVDAAPGADTSYTDVAKKLLDHGVNLVGVIRDGSIFVGFEDLTLAQGDSLVYISKTRHSRQEISALLS